MLGVLVVLRPDGAGMLTVGGLAILGAAVCYAVSAITARILARSDRSEHMVFWLIFLIGAGATVLAAPDWVPLRSQDLLIVCGLAVSGFLGQLAINEAFSTGEASVVAPFEYTALAWGVALDWLLWAALPDRYTLIGAAIIIGSGIYLVRHEQVHTEGEHP
jgi:drug/metabolite transporter (DMT)-like permease